jgi:hypothetical protein
MSSGEAASHCGGEGMNAPLTVAIAADPLDHTQLPDKDGQPVENDLELPQSILLTESIRPVLRTIHVDGRFWIGADCGIYWRKPRRGEPPLRCAVAPDWYYVPNVDPKPRRGLYRRSYVLWQEQVVPLLAIEYVSGDGSEERDSTPQTGKFWIYEHGIKVPYYAIYEVDPGRVAVYHRVRGRYRRQRPNQRGHYPIKPLEAELGIWQGWYQDRSLPWLRWYDAQGQLLLNDAERAEQAERRAEQAERRAKRLAQRLRELGLDPEA